MTVQQKNEAKRDALLVLLVKITKDMVGDSFGSSIRLNADDEQRAIDECGFEDREELEFFIRSQSDLGLLRDDGAIAFQIEEAGYERVENLRPRRRAGWRPQQG